VARGAIQQMRTSAVSFTGMMASFCGKLRWWQLQVLNRFTCFAGFTGRC
jgi:hypothetical protein